MNGIHIYVYNPLAFDWILMWYIPVYDRLHVFETIVSQEKWLYIIFPWNINLTWADLQTRICLAIYHFQSLSEWSKRTRVLQHKSVLLFLYVLHDNETAFVSKIYGLTRNPYLQRYQRIATIFYVMGQMNLSGGRGYRG